MKRLILMGGRPWVAKGGGEYQTKVLFRYFKNTARLAFCNFAQDETDWKETISTNLTMFKKFYDGDLQHRVMTRDTLESDSKWADIIYIPGGDPFKLLAELKTFNLDDVWNHKVIAGASAGADLFCAAFPYLQERKFGEGLGWLNVVMIPHWRDDFNGYTHKDWDWAEQTSLKKYPKLPVLCIPEGEFVEFSVR